MIDILLVNNETHLIVSGVCDPFLNQEIRYHCPIYGIFSKPKFVSFSRRIWDYDQGNYELLRNKATSFNWDSIKDNDSNTYAKKINTTVTSFAKECIPNRCIKVKPSEPPWINFTIKRNIRKRKRAYRKVKRTYLVSDWNKLKKYVIELFKIIFAIPKNYFTTKLQLNFPLKHFLQKTVGLHLKCSLLLIIKQLFHPLNLTMIYTWMKMIRQML